MFATLTMNTWDHAWVALSVMLVSGLIVGKWSERLRVPDVALFLVLGIALGPYGFSWFSEPVQAETNQFILNLGAAIILFDGGRSVQVSVLRSVWVTITSLATVGVLITAFVMALVVHGLLHLDWTTAWLLAAVIASTDPATLIPVFKRYPIQARLQQTLESESAFNDATASVLVFSLLAVVQGVAGGNPQNTRASGIVLHALMNFLLSAGVGLASGVVCGVIALWLISDRGFGAFHEFASLVLLGGLLSSYAIATALGASGLMAAFAAGIVTGNGEVFRLPLMEHTELNIRHFGNTMTLLMRIFIFVLLGTQVDFHAVGHNLVPGLLGVGALMFLARPLTVLASASWDRRAKWSVKELVMMSWVRETGVIPAVLAGVVVSRNIAGSQLIASVTFLAILVTILVQATSTPLVARSLGLMATPIEEDV